MTYDAAHHHGLHDVAAYEVYETIDPDGNVLIDVTTDESLGKFIARYEGAKSYTKALDAANCIRRAPLGRALPSRSWAVIDWIYEDGCRSR